MKHLLIGTAGHIDHGKTALIKALTGMDTDRLDEEKRRGITIDLGFAHMEIPNGTAGIIDVPGHEKFIKNMLAGAGALDFVLMVVAADEGVMPQTREHLAILELLGVTKGCIVLTKCDLVDDETLELAREDIREAFSGTFLESAPIFPVSCKTGEGISGLRQAIIEFSQKIPEHNDKRPFRMAADRVFSLDGFGTVVTGTVLDGTIQEGDEVQLYPGKKTARVRTLQMCGKQAQAVSAGQRAALNLARIKPEEVSRGDWLAVPGSQMAVTRLEVKLSLLKGTERILKNGARLHLHLGAACVICRVSLAEKETLKAGETAYAQLRLETSVCAFAGDRFVVRFYSPVETIGGGVVFDARPRRQKRLDSTAVKRLKWYDTGSLSQQILYEISCNPMSQATLAAWFPHIEADRLIQTVEALCFSGKLLAAGELLFTQEQFEIYREKLMGVLQEYHAAHPLEWGIPLPELKKRFSDELVESFTKLGEIRCGAGWAAETDFSPFKTHTFHIISQKVVNLYAEWGMMPQEVSNVPAKIGEEPAKTMRVVELLLKKGTLEQLTTSLLVAQTAFQKAKDTAARLIHSGGGVTLAQFRDELQLSRKYAAALLEHMDSCGFTEKNNDLRTLL